MAESVFYLASETEGLEPVHVDEMEHAVTTAHTEQAADHGADHGSGGGVAEVGIWLNTLLAFGIAFFVLKKFAFPRIIEALDQRNEKIEGDLKNAELTRDEADKVLAEYKAQLDEARTEAKKIIDEGKALGENLRQETIAKAQQEANQLISRAREEIAREKEKAIKELQGQIADISVEVASKVVQKSLSKEEHGKLIDDYVTEVSKLYEG